MGGLGPHTARWVAHLRTVKPEVAKQEFKAKMGLKEGKMTVTVSCFHTHSDGGGRTYGAVQKKRIPACVIAPGQ